MDARLTAAPGEVVALMGPSGAGKSTLLSVVSGLVRAERGYVRVDGADVSSARVHVPPQQRGVVLLGQQARLFPHLSARENVAFALVARSRRGARVSRALRRAEADRWLDRVGLGADAARLPEALSGGQQQRVALARALVTEPRVLLLDEPLSALDAKVRVQLRDEIRRLQLRLGITTVFVTHDQEEALAVSDRIAVMDAGRIEQIGTPEELYLRPQTPVVAAFVGLSSVLPGVAAGDRVTVWGTSLPVATGQATGQAAGHTDGPVEVLVRPENVRVHVADGAADASGAAGQVEECTFLGSFRRSVVRTDDGAIVHVQHGSDERLEYGQRVRLTLAPVPVAVRAAS